jgi:hypothetical protein
VYCNNLAYCNFRDLFIESMTEYGFYLTNSSQCNMTNIRAKNCVTAGFWLSAVATYLNNCLAHGLSSGNGFHIEIAGGALHGCVVDHVGGLAFYVTKNAEMLNLVSCYTEGAVGGALKIDKGAGSYVKSINVIGGGYSCHAGATAAAVIELGDCDNVAIIGASLANVEATIPGFLIGAATDTARLTNNRFSGPMSKQYDITAGADVHVDDTLFPQTYNRGAAATVADGGTIAHGLWTTPTYVLVTPSVADEYAAVTALGATTFTVALTKHDGSAGTTQTIYWRAEV